DEDVEIELNNDAELIFPYEVEGDKTPPPRDESSDSEPPNAESSDSVSSDSESSDSKPEDEEAELSTNQAEIALLKSKNMIKMLKLLERGENATLKKRLTETETKLAWARIERDIAEGRLH
ncbi:hypothetical protein Tco_1096238, partial [Tanacetum coccineum]